LCASTSGWQNPNAESVSRKAKKVQEKQVARREESRKAGEAGTLPVTQGIPEMFIPRPARPKARIMETGGRERGQVKMVGRPETGPIANARKGRQEGRLAPEAEDFRPGTQGRRPSRERKQQPGHRDAEEEACNRMTPRSLANTGEQVHDDQIMAFFCPTRVGAAVRATGWDVGEEMERLVELARNGSGKTSIDAMKRIRGLPVRWRNSTG
jgi:hypothetical protein